MLRFTLALGATSLLALTSVALAQDAPPTYKADPDGYKLIFEDQNFRVIDTVRKKGVHDKLHSHPVPFVIYYVTDCKDQLYGPDGKPVGPPSEAKAGTARSFPVVHAHSVRSGVQNRTPSKRPTVASDMRWAVCPSWVRLGHSAMAAQCPVCPKADTAGRFYEYAP